MNWNIVEGNWKQFMGAVKGRWGKFTDDRIGEVAGKGDEVAGKAQSTYGVAQDEVLEKVTKLADGGKK